MFPASLPESHKSFLESALAKLKRDERILGVAAAGSYISDELDPFSDLDLVIVCDPVKQPAMIKEAKKIAQELGRYLVGFSGEHVGEPRLFISLFEDPTLHVDLKFVSIDDFPVRIENPVVLWERDGQVSKLLETTSPSAPAVDLQWIEDRFWVWIHYGAMKLGRGELFETLDLLSFLRTQVLGPLALEKKNKPPRGVRRVEQYCKEDIPLLASTVATYDAGSCEQALRAAAKTYLDFRETLAPAQLVRHRRAEMAAMQYLHQVCGDLGRSLHS